MRTTEYEVCEIKDEKQSKEDVYKRIRDLEIKP